MLHAADEGVLQIIETQCKHCHGAEGEASSTVFPRLAHQHKNYIIKQLTDFREKRRIGTMNEVAAKLTDSEIVGLADYFSAKPALSHRVRDMDLAGVGHFIFTRGNPYSEVPACNTCHGENGEGSDTLPRLAGQHKQYISLQLQEFDRRTRNNDNAIMHLIASRLSALEREAVALYASGLR
ncbi:MAG: cytochrome c4 [Gammaproteobacteria bacterium]|nr:cytochrome c4 [Gammaproteobacteria bacterium]